MKDIQKTAFLSLKRGADLNQVSFFQSFAQFYGKRDESTVEKHKNGQNQPN